jgi:hypothetical protein
VSEDPGETLIIHSAELAKLLGFDVNKTYTVSILDVPLCDCSYGVKSDRIVDFSLNEYVFLDIEEFRGPFFNDLSNLNSVSACNMFAVVPMDVCSGQVKTFKETSDYVMTQNFSPMRDLSKITVHWYDKNINSINFQGFENNSFILRLYTKRVVNIVDQKRHDTARNVIDSYIRQVKDRIAEEEYQKTQQQKKKKVIIGKWALVVGILGVLLFWYFSPAATPIIKKIA